MDNETRAPTTVAKFLSVAEANGTPGEDSIVAWISTDTVDREGEVLVASGIDYKGYLENNPAVMAVHNYEQFPIGTCDPKVGGWIKPRSGKGFNGLVAKFFFDTDEASQFIAGKYKRGIARGVSVGCRRPADLKPGEWGPPTAAELKARPDWANAKRIIRRCELFEFSLCAFPVNPMALVIEKAMTPVSPEVRRMIDESQAETVGTEETEEPEPENKAVTEPVEPVVEPEPTPKAMTESSASAGGYMVKAGDYAEWGKGRSAGCGKVMSIHKSGKVPGVAEQVEGSEDDPAAKVKCYAKAMDSGKWQAIDRHMGHKVKDLSHIPHEMAEMDDAEEEAAPTPKAVVSLSALPPLPACRSRAEVEEERVREIAVKAMESLYGAV